MSSVRMFWYEINGFLYVEKMFDNFFPSQNAGDEPWRVVDWMGRVSEGCQKIAKAMWRFHPPARHRVFEAVLKNGWPSAPCQGANMAETNLFKTSPVREQYLCSVLCVTWVFFVFMNFSVTLTTSREERWCRVQG